MPKKCIMILLDGLGDRSYPELDHRTPLQAARTPFLDRLAREGASGLYHAAAPGQALPSEKAHFAMFGYDMDGFPGRGALEALGAGISMESGKVAALAHFVTARVTAEGILILENGKPEAPDDEIRALIKTIGRCDSDGVHVRLHHTQGFRGILTLAGNVAPFVTDTDPIRHGRPMIAISPWAGYHRNPAVLNTVRVLTAYLQWVWRALQHHPVNTVRQKAGRPVLNALVTQRAGRLRQVAPFSEAYGMRGLSIASGMIYHGLAAYLGMHAHKVADTGQPGDDLARRLETALKKLPEYDFIHVHTKTPDEAAHTKDPMAKIRVIEALDKGVANVWKVLTTDPEVLLVVASDHSTPSSGPLIHSGESVPLVFFGPGVRRDNVRHFDEIHAANGALGFVRGKELMYLILNHLDRARLQGIMDVPEDRPYWPGRYEPFRIGEEGDH
jgi:2,3-bisphosphoglycerate-independent phosphoglycerate mutase